MLLTVIKVLFGNRNLEIDDKLLVPFCAPPPAGGLCQGDHCVSRKPSAEMQMQSAQWSVSVQAIYMTGWAPHERQQQPLPRGSATASFEDIEKAFNPQKQ